MTVTGSVGKQAKYLVKSCTIRQSLISLNLEIDILKSRVDFMQVLMNSQCNTTTSEVCKLRNEITLVKIDLEQEKSRNMYLECDVKRLRQEVERINPRANGAKRRARVLIPHGYLHPGKGKHSEV